MWLAARYRLITTYQVAALTLFHSVRPKASGDADSVSAHTAACSPCISEARDEALAEELRRVVGDATAACQQRSWRRPTLRSPGGVRARRGAMARIRSSRDATSTQGDDDMHSLIATHFSSAQRQEALQRAREARAAGVARERQLTPKPAHGSCPADSRATGLSVSRV